MEETIIQILARELERPEQHVRNIIALLDEGNTVPFIARYRKELHGGMDDQLIRQLAERLQYLRNLQHPSEVLSVGDVVTVWVKEVDEKKKRISLTMRKDKL